MSSTRDVVWERSRLREIVSGDTVRIQRALRSLYLTPITSNKSFMQEIVKGEWKDWAAFILRQVTGPALKDFPLKTFTPLPIDNECIYYSDRDRWSSRED